MIDNYEMPAIVTRAYEPNITEIKHVVNNLLWSHGNEGLTIGEAEERALAILELITSGPKRAS